jgi:hypothetical protein
MDHRTETFTRKFGSASQLLGVKPSEIISLKLRENISSYGEYGEFLRVLEREAGLKSVEVKGELQGKGYLLTDDNSRVLLVEHETGLEILYIAGSIASLVSLLPMVLQWWRVFRGRYFRRRDSDDHDIEIRKLDEKGRLIEDHVRDSASFTLSPLNLNEPLAAAAKNMERDLHSLNDEMRSLKARVEVLEKNVAKGNKKTKPPRRIGKKSK